MCFFFPVIPTCLICPVTYSSLDSCRQVVDSFCIVVTFGSRMLVVQTVPCVPIPHAIRYMTYGGRCERYRFLGLTVKRSEGSGHTPTPSMFTSHDPLACFSALAYFYPPLPLYRILVQSHRCNHVSHYPYNGYRQRSNQPNARSQPIQPHLIVFAISGNT